MSRVLLADDSPQALRLAESILQEEGLEVVSVTDGTVALRRLHDFKPDLLISDMYLTGKSAFEIARSVRAQPEHHHLRIIFAASPQDEFNEQDAKNAGANVILRKPFEASVLLGSVKTLLEEGRQLQASQPAALSSGPDRHTIRAAVTLALDSAMPAMIEELTERVLLALAHRR